MAFQPRPMRPRHKLRPKARPRLFVPSPLPQTSLQAQWAPQQVTLEELLLDYQLPQLVMCRTPILYSNSHDSRSPTPVPLDHPILLAEQRSVRHLLARIVVFDQRSGAFNESSDSVVIPEDYDGYFLRLQSRTTKDRTHVHSLQSIAQCDTPAFMSLSNITSFPADSADSATRMVYTAGNVFLVDEPLPNSGEGAARDGQDRRHSDRGDDKASAISATSTHTGRSGKSSGSSSHKARSGCIRCLDERGVAVLVPVKQKVEVMKIQRRGQETRLSVKSSEMIENEQFPLLVRFAYGKKPPRLTDFTKLFTLLDSFQENSIIACTLNGATLNLFEIPVTSSLQFQVALNGAELLSAPSVQTALETCRTTGRELARDIKFKYKFSHRVQEASRRLQQMKELDGEEDDMPSATMRTRLIVTETYVYI